MTIAQERLRGRRYLAEAGIGSAALDVALLLMKVTGLGRTALIVHDDEELSGGQLHEFDTLLAKRATGYPMAYILGYRDFYGLRLEVDEHTLIPRPATETLVDEALSQSFDSVADLGCGSGAIILALKASRPHSRCCAVDFSEGALEVAKRNASSLNLEVEFLHGSWFEPLKGRRFDLIVSNPPYIEEQDHHLQETSLPFEPVTALTSGEDGLDDLRVIVKEAPAHLNAGGCLMCEHGFDQGDRVRTLFADSGFIEIETVRDLGGLERVTRGCLTA